MQRWITGVKWASAAPLASVKIRMPLILEENELKHRVYDDKYTEFALHKIPSELGREQEYERQSFFLT